MGLPPNMEDWTLIQWRWPSLEEVEEEDWGSIYRSELSDEEGAEAIAREPAHNPGQLIGSQSPRDITGDVPGDNRTTPVNIDILEDAAHRIDQRMRRRRVVHWRSPQDEDLPTLEEIRATFLANLDLPGNMRRSVPAHAPCADVTGDGAGSNITSPSRIEEHIFEDQPQEGAVCRIVQGAQRGATWEESAGQQSGSQDSTGTSGDGPDSNTTPATSPYGLGEWWWWTSLTSAEQAELAMDEVTTYKLTPSGTHVRNPWFQRTCNGRST